MRSILFIMTITLLMGLGVALANNSSETLESRRQKLAGEIKALAGNGTVMLVSPTGETRLAINVDKQLIPASILKVVVAAAALDFLGPEYRFSTEFRVGPEGDLSVAGRGDPLLISEELAYIADKLKEKGLTRIRDIRLDSGFFLPNLVLDGTERSLNPYDAYNGALSVNFNTIFVEIGSGGRVASAEPQTPLTELAQSLAVKSRAQGKIRLNLADRPETCLLYAGQLLRVFLERDGIAVEGRIGPATGDQEPGPIFYRHASRQDLRWVINQLFRYSNNFITNQLFLTLGAEKFGPPADPEKARRAVAEYLTARNLKSFHIEEGSGLSRRTRVSAALMAGVLEQFKGYRHLMSARGPALYKTGTLSDVKSLVGYIETDLNEPWIFVVILNGPEFKLETRDWILERIEEYIK